ncbi:rCG32479 [Rattus norvegicus]|uniref:RCG32479 n=1 Tax=Rattus norvegicus TaxID=10116 RepID=A6HHB6_RAT|nr:rCG32479 [Rattus norvegicus]
MTYVSEIKLKCFSFYLSYFCYQQNTRGWLRCLPRNHIRTQTVKKLSSDLPPEIILTIGGPQS